MPIFRLRPGCWRGSITSWLRGSTAALAALVLSACTMLPAQVDRPFSSARPAAADSPLAQIANDSSPGPALTGFRLLPDGMFSLDARIELVNRARHSLDVQYYLIQDDRSGRLLMRNLRDAAMRGVRVRLLVDDLYTTGADPMFIGLAAFPNVEVRLFNPFCCARQSIVGKFTASLADFRRLNHRMHNKLLIADGAAAIMGGRNISDQYFTRSATSNFVDMDVLLVGPVVGQLSGIFDAYWNSPEAYPLESITGAADDGEAVRGGFNHLVRDGEQMMSVVLPPIDILGYGPLGEELDSGRLRLVWGTAVALADQPGKVMATSAEMARSMSVQMNIMDRVMLAKSDVVISSPYFIPGTMGVQDFDTLRRRNVKVTILTNSLAANDVPLVHTGYARYRAGLLRSGVDLYELSPTRIRHDDQIMLPGMSLGRLHAKAAVIDGSMVYIGSMNLDPRSESTNTELGIVANCPALATDVLHAIDISKRKSSYKVRFARDSEQLEWEAADATGNVVLTEEPEVTPLMLLRTRLLAPFIPEQLL
jgi:putative cardiolipin synthase